MKKISLFVVALMVFILSNSSFAMDGLNPEEEDILRQYASSLDNELTASGEVEIYSKSLAEQDGLGLKSFFGCVPLENREKEHELVLFEFSLLYNDPSGPEVDYEMIGIFQGETCPTKAVVDKARKTLEKKAKSLQSKGGEKNNKTSYK